MFVAINATAQDTIPSNSTDSVKVHSVKRAVLLSTALPGAGQVYNHIAMPKGKKKAYWKVPLIYAGLGASTYFLVSNQLTQRELKNEYTLRQDTGIGADKWANYDDQGILTLYNQYLDWRDLSILATAGVYLLQIVDAGVEAHFVSFDISEDLSLSVEPTIMSNFSGGLKVRLKIR
jgi:hypothetical protein